MKKLPFKRALLYGSVAAVIYFFIAYFTNQGHSFEVRVRASLAHALFCMGMTFFSTIMMESFFNIPKRAVLKYLFAIFGAGGVSLSLMIGVHLLVGIPEIIKTVLASAVTSLPYYILFPMKLLHEYRKQQPVETKSLD